MPSERFLNLPAEKRDRIVQAAIKEISKTPFKEVSINQIIKQAKIPRGSFYQYFSGKGDMLEYIMQGFGASLHQRALGALQTSGGDVFHMFCELLRCVFEIAAVEENHDFIKNIIVSLQPEGEYSFRFLMVDKGKLIEYMRRYIDMDRLRYGEKTLEVLLDVLIALAYRTIARAFCHGGNAQTALAEFEAQLELVKTGALSAGKGEMKVG